MRRVIDRSVTPKLPMNHAPARSRRSWLAAALCLLATVPAFAAAPPMKIAGLTFAGEIPLGGQVLQLNGVGVRAVAWFKGYAAGLYLSARARSPAQALATPGAKRLEMRMLVDVETEEFIKAIHKGIERNTPPAGQPALADRIARLDDLLRALSKVNKRDVIDLDWQPDRGFQLVVNGQPRGEPMAGDDLYAALLLIFIGEKPVDADLKAGLLGKPQP